MRTATRRSQMGLAPSKKTQLRFLRRKVSTLFRGPRREKVAPTEQPKSGVEERQKPVALPWQHTVDKRVPRTSTIFCRCFAVSAYNYHRDGHDLAFIKEDARYSAGGRGHR